MTDRKPRVPSDGATDETDEPFVVEYTPDGTTRKRTRFEPRQYGPGWWRVSEEWTGCTWRPIGREPVTDVVVRRTVSNSDADHRGDVDDA